MNLNSENEHAVLGQKYAYATAALLVGIASYISLLGMEKAILAILFAWMALRAAPAPALHRRRGWGTAGAVLGGVHLVIVLAVLVVGWHLVAAMLQYLSETAVMIARGPKIAMQVSSPDSQFTAYVEEMPSIDPPNQSLWVERKDQRHFMHIADLAEDVDSIQQVYWSPDSQIVVFQSRDYLTATRVTDWQTIRVYLGKEWVRHKPGRHSTFSSGGQGIAIEKVEFPGPDRITYRFQGQEHTRNLSFGAELSRER